MAFVETALTALSGAKKSAGGDSCTLYLYVTDDTAAAVETDGYFDGALDNGLLTGDIIIGSLQNAATNQVKIYIVRQPGADVTIALQTVT